ncbi:MAG: hypothetical protein LBU61_02640 [Coriobacteriales bacterium]|nr:hypothetical protein [Coriobacteriales bacterium]
MLFASDGILLVDWDTALAQRRQEKEAAKPPIDVEFGEPSDTEPGRLLDDVDDSGSVDTIEQLALAGPTSYFGAVKINSNLYAGEIAKIGRGVLDRLIGYGAKLELSLEIKAAKLDGFTENEIRTINENATNLGFDSDSGFEEEE